MFMKATKANEDFRNWLISEQRLQKRSAGDLVSRRNKLLSLINDPTNLTLEVLKLQLEELSLKLSLSQSTLSAMIRSERLYRKFKSS